MIEDKGLWLEDISNSLKIQETSIAQILEWRKVALEYLISTIMQYQQTLAYILCNHPDIVNGEFIINKDELRQFIYSVRLDEQEFVVKIQANKERIND